MMSRQQFRTNTTRPVSRPRVPKEVNGGPVSINGAQSYESGYSHISRRSEQVAIPTTINKPVTTVQGGRGREETIHKVRIIIAGRLRLQYHLVSIVYN